MPRAEDRRRRRLLELIELEGGLNPPTRQIQAGHYAIAARVYDFEDNDGDFRQMAQSLRQVVRGKINLGPATVARIEEAYAIDKRHGLYIGWFDEPPAESGDSDFAPVDGTSYSPPEVMETFGSMFTAWSQLPEENRGAALAEINRLLSRWAKPRLKRD